MGCAWTGVGKVPEGIGRAGEGWASRTLSRFVCRLDRFAELNRHLVTSVAQRTRADHLTPMAGERTAGAGDINPAHLTDGKRLTQEERHAAEREIADENLVRVVGGGAVEDGQDRPALQRAAGVPAAVTFRQRGARGRTKRNIRYATHTLP